MGALGVEGQGREADVLVPKQCVLARSILPWLETLSWSVFTAKGRLDLGESIVVRAIEPGSKLGTWVQAYGERHLVSYHSWVKVTQVEGSTVHVHWYCL